MGELDNAIKSGDVNAVKAILSDPAMNVNFDGNVRKYFCICVVTSSNQLICVCVANDLSPGKRDGIAQSCFLWKS